MPIIKNMTVIRSTKAETGINIGGYCPYIKTGTAIISSNNKNINGNVK